MSVPRMVLKALHSFCFSLKSLRFRCVASTAIFYHLNVKIVRVLSARVPVCMC